MQLKRTGAAAGFAALFVAVIAAFTMSPSVPKSSASETSVEESIKALAGAFSMLAQDVRAQKLKADERDRIEDERSKADVISRQQLTEAIERLTAQIEKKP